MEYGAVVVDRCRAMFYYRGDTLFNLRYGHYKAHFYTWATPQAAIDIVSLTLFQSQISRKQ